MKGVEETAHNSSGDAMRAKPRAISIAILAMGGEGGGVLADWIVDLAEHSGYCAQTTSVPGVAQRTGATIYYVEIFPDAAVRSSGKEPVLALMPVPGEVDIVIASELMEAGRAVQRGLVTPERTTFVASTHRVYSMTEKTAADDGRVDAAKLAEGCQKAAKVALLRDFARIASEKRSVISAVLFGALAETEALPFSPSQFEEAIRRGGVGVESSLSAFAAGLAAANQARQTIGEVGRPYYRSIPCAVPRGSVRCYGAAHGLSGCELCGEVSQLSRGDSRCGPAIRRRPIFAPARVRPFSGAVDEL